MSTIKCSVVSSSGLPGCLRDLCEKERPMRLPFSVGFDRDNLVESWHLAVNLRVVQPVAMKKIFRAREANSEEKLVGLLWKERLCQQREYRPLCVRDSRKEYLLRFSRLVAQLGEKENGYYGI
jgi:hypothetical protein